ncbi:nuclear transport factor 2 family protein [Mycobacterium sp. HM-7]
MGVAVDVAAELVEIAAIKELKARYCRLLDAKQWGPWRALFSDDFFSDTSQSGGRAIIGADAFVAFVRKNLGRPSRQTVHQVHAPEIEMTSSSTALGIWALSDVVALLPGITLTGYGHYHETYFKVGDQWQIAASTLTRLREDLAIGPISIRVSPRWRDAAAWLSGIR